MNWTLVILLVVEFLFGIGFNWFTALSEERGWIEGYTSLFVTFGVFVTVTLMGPIIGWDIVGLLAAAFTASGLPMIVGSMARHARARRQEEAHIAQIAEETAEESGNGDQT